MSQDRHRLRRNGANPMGGPSFEVLQIGRVLAGVGTLRSVDLGGGTGRNSIFLASEGFDASLIELDAELCADARFLATDRSLSLNVLQGDVTAYVGEGAYDLVLLLGILHFLSVEDATRIIERYQGCTTAKGAHLITIAPSLPEDRFTNSLEQQGYRGSMSRDLIEKAYRGWTLLAYERYRKTDDHLEGSLDAHVIEKFVFVQKPDGAIGRSLSRVSLSPSGGIDGRTEELVAALYRHDIRDTLEQKYGPADFVLLATGSATDVALIADRKGALELTVAFWGRVKCYFENSVLVGFAEYETDQFHLFGGS